MSACAQGFALQNVGYEIAGTPILHPLSVELAGGEVIGLVGQNGSGKSTLVKLLARQLTPTGGELRYQGKPLERWASRDLARRIAYLPQHPATGTGLSAREVVAFGRYPWHGPFGRFGTEDGERVRAAMERTGTSALAERDLDTLSGGERQRVWLAMLVAQDAQCLLLDEPTSALDIAHQIEVLTLVRSLSREGGRCVVIVLHDVNMAARFCDRIVALRGGRLAVDESVGRFMTPQSLRAVYGLDMRILAHPPHDVGVAVPT
ncbi:ABC transporter ATP-binding protein [Aureimonas populi]|uniref:ABC transporter ATP-binding protein n=1 Tax=Aureimonas populi TaxID=1701758 RepID=A0ABW5CIG3_9HYPH|nr:ABC transporter ATP-binding protein [Aureimonas populi]